LARPRDKAECRGGCKGVGVYNFRCLIRDTPRLMVMIVVAKMTAAFGLNESSCLDRKAVEASTPKYIYIYILKMSSRATRRMRPKTLTPSLPPRFSLNREVKSS